MEERDQDAFKIMYNEAMKSLKNDPKTAEFAEYFDKEYGRTVQSWAYCYRQHAGLNTNMHLERMHGIIKYIYLKGNKPKRLDIAIHALMRYLRDKLFDKLISYHKGKLTSKISAIRQRHISSLNLDTNEVIKNDDCDLWKVFSNTKTEIYEVTKINDTCNCDLKCDECNICIHAYICTCPDSSIKFNMCKHIHLVRKLIWQKENVLTCNNDTEEGVLVINDEPTNSDLHKTIVSDLQNKEKLTDNSDLKSKKDRIMNQFLDVLNEATSDEDLKLISKMIAQSQATMRAANSLKQNATFSTVATEEPLQKRQKFDPQRKFVSTKKQREKNKQLSP